MSSPEHITQYLHRLVERKSGHGFDVLRKPGVIAHPIPFFGRILDAQVATVGINPSATEFENRKWPSAISPEQLFTRLHGYFENPDVPRHPWFSKWEDALQPLNVSYAEGTAAHLDISARATKSMGSIPPPQRQLFETMLAQDCSGFFELLPLMPRLKLLYLAGCTSRRYLHDFLQREAPRFGYQLKGDVESVGQGRTGWFNLTGPDLSLPVFFCSVSPSSRTSDLLIERTHAHAQKIRTYLID